MKHSDTTDKVLAAFYAVYNTLGYGFLEKVYENAMFEELKEMGVRCERQVPVKVTYKGTIVGDYFADLVVEGTVIVELKCAESVVYEHEIQLINYLKATGIEVGLLLNFGKTPQIRRKIFSPKA
jgi:GxxExxY protein